MESKLFNIRCDNCGAEYRINSRGEMNCPFCGSKIYLNDKDFEEYLKTREEMLVKDKLANDLANSDGDVLHKWNNELTKTVESKNKPINIRYYYQYEHHEKEVYVGSTKVVIIFKNSQVANKAISRVQELSYPSADIKGLAMFFPLLSHMIELDDGRCLVVYDKPENVYPLALFNKLDPKQVAWIISRMENFACLFQYNAIDTWELDKYDLYINPKTHQVYILDGWEFVNPLFNFDNGLLTATRKIAKDLMYIDRAPKDVITFIESKPMLEAYDDFDWWDKILQSSYNGHHFVPFTED